MSIFIKRIITPAGTLIAGVNDDGIWLCDYEYRSMMPKIRGRICSYSGKELIEGYHHLHDLLEAQLSAYFEGSLTAFDLPLQFSGSPFQVNVWESLLKIPYAKTRTYKEQSIAFGDEKAIRAIATANGANCLAIIVPCHRVVSANGSLTGYSGGLQSKQWLLEHERKHSASFYQAALF